MWTCASTATWSPGAVCGGIAYEVPQDLRESVGVSLQHAVHGLHAEVALAEKGQVPPQVLEEVFEDHWLGPDELTRFGPSAG